MQWSKAWKTGACSTVMALSAAAPVARAQTADDAYDHVEVLERRIEQLEKKLEAAAGTHAQVAPGAVTAGTTKGSFKLPGSDTSIAIGGYVKLDAVYSNPSAGVGSTADLFLQPNAIPVGPGAGDNEHNQVKFGARESRLFVKTSAPTRLGELATYVEGDFYGADGNESVSNSHGLRLRHAYGSLGHLLAGQTWTNFMFVPALPETLDFGGPVGQIFDRQAQVRWTQTFKAPGALRNGQWSVAFENPETVVTLPGGASLRADDDRLPDVTGQVVFDTVKGKFAIAALLRQIRVDTSSPTVVDHATGTAISVAGIVPALGKDDVRFTVTAGNGIGRYSNGFFPDAVIGEDARLRLPRQWGWFAAYRHAWTDALRSNVVLSAAGESNPSGTSGSTNKGTQSAHVNVIWSPVPKTDLGLEYIRASRQIEDGQTGHVSRLQASAKYVF